MDSLTQSPLRVSTEDIAAGGFLPAETPLAMLSHRLDEPMRAQRAAAGIGAAVHLRRLFVLAGTALLTAAGGLEMYDVLKVGGVTVLEGLLLGFFLTLLAWIAFSFLPAIAGFCVLLAGRQPGLPIDSEGPLPGIASRTAMLLPTYNEDPHHVMARLRAMVEQVAETGHGARFDWFLLSDTTDPDIWIEEELAFIALRRACGAALYYRHRSDNTAKKSGNIAEWVRRFGAAYDHMIVLDADSLMAADTIVRLVHAMETNPDAALIQTQPVIVNARSLFGRLQQFAGRVYGPLIAAGNAWWHGPDSNYWGHNAIIRVKAFAEEAGLPELRGRKPFGGHILSHDFVEAALMRRAGWAIYMAPTLGGSFEEGPPSMLDFAARDRRWCQGNLQHLAVLPARGLRWVSRLHLMTGIGSYLTAPLWLIFLVLGLLISLQAYFVRPEYFPKGFALFPTWPAQDPVLAAWVFAATMGLLILPKLLAYVVVIGRRNERIAFAGSLRVLAGILVETVLAALMAPSMMIFQSSAVAGILLGRDAGWQVQRRGDGEVTRREIYHKFAAPTLVGFVMGLSAYAVSVPLLLWMLPVVAGLVLALPMGLLTSRRMTTAALFATAEDKFPPPVVSRASQLAAAPRAEKVDAFWQLQQNRELLHHHLAALPARRVRPGQIDIPSAVARAKIEECGSFDDVMAWLDRTERRAILSDAKLLQRFLQMPRSRESGRPA
jgi:membrane glycosyltransferase